MVLARITRTVSHSLKRVPTVAHVCSHRPPWWANAPLATPVNSHDWSVAMRRDSRSPPLTISKVRQPTMYSMYSKHPMHCCKKDRTTDYPFVRKPVNHHTTSPIEKHIHMIWQNIRYDIAHLITHISLIPSLILIPLFISSLDFLSNSSLYPLIFSLS